MPLQHRFPDPAVLLALPPEELAGYVLEFLVQRKKEHVANVATGSSFESYPHEFREPARKAVMEAWVHLLREGLIAPEPGNPHSVFFVTRRGLEIASQASYKSFSHSHLFPLESVHPLLRNTVYSLFLSRNFDTAVFEAFKTVEVEVRSAGTFPDTLIGVDLMRKAFHEDTGPLTDQSEPAPERQALSALFAGAIARFKNPSSHRHVNLGNPQETVEMIQFASHLLRVVDERRKS